MHGNSTQRSSLAGGVGMGEKLALWCKEAKIQIASLVLQPLLLSDNGQRKSDQLFTVGRLLSAYSFFQINICVTKLLFVCHLRLNTL